MYAADRVLRGPLSYNDLQHDVLVAVKDFYIQRLIAGRGIVYLDDVTINYLDVKNNAKVRFL